MNYSEIDKYKTNICILNRMTDKDVTILFLQSICSIVEISCCEQILDLLKDSLPYIDNQMLCFKYLQNIPVLNERPNDMYCAL